MSTSLTQAIVLPSTVSSRRDWAFAAAALTLGLGSFGFLFYPEIATAIHVWSTSDAYNHCFLILPVAAYLIWDRRHLAVASLPRPALWVALLAIPAAVGWFAAERLGIMEARQLMALVLLQIMIASFLGPRTWRLLAAPLLYLFFLVPFGEFVVPPLQNLVVHFTTSGLNLLGVPNFSNGITIETPEGTFIVHEACSGLRFLIASVAFSVLYACLIYTRPFRRTLFIALSLAVAIIANCFRVLGIILIAHFLGNAQAVETGHVLWGWAFYVIIGTVMILVGLMFREQPQPARLAPLPFLRPRSPVLGIVPLILVVSPVLAAQAAANRFDDAVSGIAAAARIVPPALDGCHTVPLASTLPAPSATDTFGVGASHSVAYQCSGGVFVLTLRRYPPRIGVRPLFSSLRMGAVPSDWDVIFQTDLPADNGNPSPGWRLTEATTQDGHFVGVATALWLDGRPSGTGIAARVSQALNTISGAAVSPVLAVVTHFGGNDLNDSVAAMRSFLPRTAPRLSELVSAWLSEPYTADAER